MSTARERADERIQDGSAVHAVIVKINEALAALEKCPKSRELSLVATHLETAEMWAERHQKKEALKA